ncbi:UNVERIFIED_CONTAM: hypothetical protein Slati_3956400 [Sesamum latifolium]|uniref:NAC domain-containing protein n=1 Tax=Sesamum latifolium TaxID=2727402 RepID=A0AAW2TPT5_9LAMI
MPSNLFMPIEIIDIYGEEDPSHIFPTSDHGKYYFFTKLKKANNNDEKYSRRSKKGIWSRCAETESVFDKKGAPFKFLKVFRYEGQMVNSSDDEDNNIHEWLLNEYTLAERFENCVKEEFADFALCKVKRNPQVNANPGKMHEYMIQHLIDQVLEQGPSVWLLTLIS